jgi:hypothetical protein
MKFSKTLVLPEVHSVRTSQESFLQTRTNKGQRGGFRDKLSGAAFQSQLRL